MNTGASRRFHPARFRVSTRGPEGQTDGLVVGRMLGLRVDADRTALLLRLALHEVDDLLEGGNLELPVELLRAIPEVLDGAELLDLGQREVGREPAFVGDPVDHHGALAGGELRMVLHVGGEDEVRLMPRDQVAILGHDEVGLDVVGAELDGERVPLQGVGGEISMGASMADDQRFALTQTERVGGLGAEDRSRRQQADDAQNQRSEDLHGPLLSSWCGGPAGCEKDPRREGCTCTADLARMKSARTVDVRRVTRGPDHR
jgi:hypothetical protein